jgi:hypothetical protein
LSIFNSHTIRLGANYDLVADGWRFLEKAMLNVYYDHILYDYKDFHDLRPFDENGAPLYAPGSEPLYSYSADVLQIYFSAWF